jgi:homoserine dehydrogenase
MLHEVESLNRTTAGIKTLRVALFGFGVVGSGVWSIIRSKRTEFRQRFGVNVEIAGVCVRDITKDRGAHFDPSLLTADHSLLLSDERIDVVFELVGGRYEALDIIERALESRKHVITANKAVLAYELPRLKRRADRQGVNLFYSASVCGSVPVLRTLDELRIGDEIQSLRGIVNGSTNFVLTLMSEEGVSYKDALIEARTRGFLEADPSLDVSGQDAAQKLSVLAYHAFGVHLRPDEIATSGIERVTTEDIQVAKDRGEALKLIARADRNSKTGTISASVGMESIEKTHLFAHTRDEFNALEIQTSHAGPQMLYGKGAGSLPTASSVVSDLVELLKEM